MQQVPKQTGHPVWYFHPLTSRCFSPTELSWDVSLKSSLVDHLLHFTFLWASRLRAACWWPRVGRETTLLAGKTQCLHLAKHRLPAGTSRSSSVTQRGECHLLSHQCCPSQLALPLSKISSSNPDKPFSETTTRGHQEMLSWCWQTQRSTSDYPSSVKWLGLT